MQVSIPRSLTILFLLAVLGPPRAQSEIRRDPNGVNVNAQGATSVFITFGGLSDQVPAEAVWCGELEPAAPDLGFRCDPATVFGRLPIRFDRSRLNAPGSVFTDIMTIPPSVARRAYQAAARGDTSSFFYVRRFISQSGGPDEYVFVTCRLTGGGARTPLALLDVQLRFADRATVTTVAPGGAPPAIEAEIAYNGTGRLIGRWEVVRPGDDPPRSDDLLTEATLPQELRGSQRRYTQVSRFNVFLPPSGRFRLDGPPSDRLPTDSEGLYQVLLRVEVSEDKESSSNLGNAGAGAGVVQAGAVAGFPLPVLRYFVGAGGSSTPIVGGFELLAPAAGARIASARNLAFSWTTTVLARLYRLEVEAADSAEGTVLEAVLQQGIGTYRAPPWLDDEVAGGELRWRVVALAPDGKEAAVTLWRSLYLGTAP